MKQTVAIASFAALLAAFLAQTHAEPQGAAISFADALATARAENPELAVSAATIASAKHELKSTKALRLPSVNVEANVLLWNESIEFDFSVPGMEPPPGMESDPIVVRDRITSQTSVTVVEPLSSQFVISTLIEHDKHGVDAAGFEHTTTKLDVVTRAAQAYLSLLLAEAALDVTSASVVQVEAQLKRARVLQEVGVLESVDVLRLESALAEAKRRSIDAETRIHLARDQLMLTLGKPVGTSFSVVDDFPKEPQLLSMDEDQAVEFAIAGRPELKASRSRVRQAHGRATVAKAELYPNVLGVATYQNNQGSGSFSSENTFFIGVTLSWNVWDWGRNWHSYKAAGAKAKKVELVTRSFEDQIVLQARAGAREARAAHEALNVARTGLEAAEEAYRIHSIRFDEGGLTTTDLLDAHTEVTRARFGFASARFTYFLKVVQLARATGHKPQELLSQL